MNLHERRTVYFGMTSDGGLEPCRAVGAAAVPAAIIGEIKKCGTFLASSPRGPSSGYDFRVLEL